MIAHFLSEDSRHQFLDLTDLIRTRTATAGYLVGCPEGYEDSFSLSATLSVAAGDGDGQLFPPCSHTLYGYAITHFFSLQMMPPPRGAPFLWQCIAEAWQVLRK